jgi:hypothetical protein
MKKLQDWLIPSVTLRTPTAEAWLLGMQATEYLCNAILALTHPALFDAGVQAILNIQDSMEVSHIRTHEHVPLWPSVFSGIGVISNRKTLRHRDQGGFTSSYDLLASAGTHRSSTINIPELGASFSYNPGTVFMICGKLLSHSVDEWEGGERICVAHYMRNMVHGRLGVHRPNWCKMTMYTRYFNKSFRDAHRWV